MNGSFFLSGPQKCDSEIGLRTEAFFPCLWCLVMRLFFHGRLNMATIGDCFSQLIDPKWGGINQSQLDDMWRRYERDEVC